MTADMLTAGTHLRGTVYREVGAVLVEDIPVVKRVRRRFRNTVLRRVDITWTCGRVARYAPTHDLPVLEVAA